jgi:hypothetical protein
VSLVVACVVYTPAVVDDALAVSEWVTYAIHTAAGLSAAAIVSRMEARTVGS